jgi:hypothetical protein
MLCMGVKALHAVTERRQRAKAGRSADFFFCKDPLSSSSFQTQVEDDTT